MTIELGSEISANDLTGVRLRVDPALNPVAAKQLDQVVGTRASLDIAPDSRHLPKNLARDLAC